MLVNFLKKSIRKSSPKNYLYSWEIELIWDLAIVFEYRLFLDGNIGDSL
jgi:hypothetical protein